MKTIRYTKTAKLKEYKEKKLIIEKFLFHLHYYEYYADSDGDEIEFNHIKNLFYYGKGGSALILVRRGKIYFESDRDLNLKVTWEIDFSSHVFLSFFTALFFSSGYFISSVQSWSNALFLFGILFILIATVLYLATKFKVSFHNNSVL